MFGLWSGGPNSVHSPVRSRRLPSAPVCVTPTTLVPCATLRCLAPLAVSPLMRFRKAQVAGSNPVGGFEMTGTCDRRGVVPVSFHGTFHGTDLRTRAGVRAPVDQVFLRVDG